MGPIGSQLEGKRLKLAELQDYVIDVIYNKIDSQSVLYGGTAIWRCFGGNRFSEEIEIYISRKSLEKLIKKLPDYGLRLISRDSELDSIITFGNDSSSLLLESKVGYGDNVIMPYYRTDGSTMVVLTLSPTELMNRKIEAYQNRGYIRDIYDLFILTGHLDKKDHTVESRLEVFLANLKAPVDESVLKSLIYSGNKDITFDELIDYIKRWVYEI